MKLFSGPANQDCIKNLKAGEYFEVVEIRKSENSNSLYAGVQTLGGKYLGYVSLRAMNLKVSKVYDTWEDKTIYEAI